MEDDYYVRDMCEVEAMIKSLEKDDAKEVHILDATVPVVNPQPKPDVQGCCSGHYSLKSQIPVEDLEKILPIQVEFPHVYEPHLFDDEEDDVKFLDVPIKSHLSFEKDELYDAITSLETDFNLDL